LLIGAGACTAASTTGTFSNSHLFVNVNLSHQVAMLSVKSFLPVDLRSVALGSSIFAFEFLIDIVINVVVGLQIIYSVVIVSGVHFQLVAAGW
jgi:hypothetical protein